MLTRSIATLLPEEDVLDDADDDDGADPTLPGDLWFRLAAEARPRGSQMLKIQGHRAPCPWTPTSSLVRSG